MGKEFKVLFEGKNEKLDLFFELIRENRLYARVHCKNNNGFFKRKVVLYEEEDGGFAFVQYLKKFKISKTNKLYTREVREISFIYKDKKFWYSSNVGRSKTFRAASINDLQTFYESKLLVEEVVKRFPWVRFMIENNLGVVSLNYMINNKLYSLMDFLKFYFKLPLPVIKVIISVYQNKLDGINVIRKTWNRNKLFLTNIENLKKDFIEDTYFQDSIRLADLLDKKINCSWSVRRLKEEHDKWSKEHREISIKLEKEYVLNVGTVFVDFGLEYGHKLLDTNVKLIEEGMKQNHCVATYVEKVNRGRCGIYHIEGYTLELVRRVDGLYISQFRGLGNIMAPVKLIDEVNLHVEEFNKAHKKELEKESVSYVYDELPF